MIAVWKKYLFVGVCFLLASYTAFPQLVINEICSKNNSILADLEGDFPDWIELHNSGSETINLSGYSLSDSPSELELWSFESGQIAPNEYLTVFASGKEIAAGEIHTNFKISSDGEALFLSNPNGTLIDELPAQPLRLDHSFGRIVGSNGNAGIYLLPTPGAENSTVAYPDYAPDPVFDELNSFFNAPIHVGVSHPWPAPNMHYSMDGSIPTIDDPVYENPLPYDHNAIIRIKAFPEGYIPSNTSTHTYFIGEDTKLPVISISTDPKNFYDQDSGIYIKGPNADTAYPFFGANYWEKWERPIHLEMYLPNGDMAFEYDLGIRIHGGSQARTMPARPMRLLAKEEFGASKIEYQVFPDKEVYEFDRLVLRNSGADFNKTHFRDGMIHRLMIKDSLHMDVLAYRPVSVFLNGAFFGIYNIRERIDNDYVHGNHPELDGIFIDLLEEDFDVQEGDSIHMYETWKFLTTNDMADADNFAYIDSRMDLFNVTDYFAAETYLNNTDWPNNNIKFWRPILDDGKWQYLFFDLDVSLNSVGWVTPETDNLARVLQMADEGSTHAMVLKGLLANDEFRRFFINRYADLMNTTFQPDYFLQEVDALEELLRDEMPDQFKRWPRVENPIENWYDEIQKTEDFIVERLPLARDDVQQAFDLERQVELQLNVYPPEAGRIRINTIRTPALPWSGVYYQGVPVTVKVKPNPGYQFSHWESLNTVPRNTAEQLTVDFATDDQLTAYFEGTSEKTALGLYPNPTANSATLTFIQQQIEEVTIGIYNSFGQPISTPLTQFFNAGSQQVSLEDLLPLNLSDGVYWVRLQSDSRDESIRLIRINGGL